MASLFPRKSRDFMKKAMFFVAFLFSQPNTGNCVMAGQLRAHNSQKSLPTMGWSSWNTYRVNISDSLIMRQADAMVEKGLNGVGIVMSISMMAISVVAIGQQVAC